MMEDILRYIDGHAETFIRDLQRLCRQPSISAQSVGIEECAERGSQHLGCKGICYVEMEVHGARRDLHSSQAVVVSNPAWRLVWALGTLKGPDEEIRIPGFYDDVVEPSVAEKGSSTSR